LRQVYPITSLSGEGRRQETFFCEEDYKEYIRLISEWSSRWTVQTWASCLMPDHVHMVVLPQSEEGLRTGRPMGNDGFVEKLEQALGRILQRQKPGQKRGHREK
jgi:DNA helicase IV